MPKVATRPKPIGEDIYTQGDNLAELREMVPDAVQCHF